MRQPASSLVDISCETPAMQVSASPPPSLTPGSELRLFQPRHPAVALGMAVSFLMTKPAFANLRFGDWSRILVGQINRGHYCFVIDAANRVQGFAGWALTNKESAEDWLEGRRALSYAESQAGDCVVVNAWAADSPEVQRFLVEEARKLLAGKQTLYFKRHYQDGSTRPVRLNVNEFVAAHIERRASAGRADDPAS
jgi:hemolysin-activating ACP:hemolysin acyltransferase